MYLVLHRMAQSVADKVYFEPEAFMGIEIRSVRVKIFAAVTDLFI